MSFDIKPIPTVYNGHKFRSRLEARWAVAFDVAKIEWVYEMEGFDLGGGVNYLPDFWLPQVKMWAEVKPCDFSEIEQEKCRRLAIGNKRSVLMLDGMPSDQNFWGWMPCWDEADCPTGEAELEDWILFAGEKYHLSENRFYQNTGMSKWVKYDANGYDSFDPSEPVRKAREHRFWQ